MPDNWSMPQIVIDEDGGLSVNTVVSDDVIVDTSDVSDPDDVEVIEDGASSGIHMSVSGNDVTDITMSVEDFKAIVMAPSSDVSENDPDLQDVPEVLIQPLAVDGSDASSSSFSPQAWQLNMAQNRPIGWHYVMTRTGTNTNNYILVLGRNVTYENGIYFYDDCDFYSVYQTGSGTSVRYVYDVNDHASGSINSSSYVVYSDLFFDYAGGRSVSYSWLIVAFLVVVVLFLIFFKGMKNR